MVNLDIEIQNNIRSAGYGIQFVGLDTGMLPLYLHKESLSDKVRGDVFLKAKIANPRTGPNNAEMQYLAKKASIGIFAWKPGEDCLVKTFENISYERVGQETKIVRGEPYLGCEWCREEPSSTIVHEADVSTSSEAEPVEESELAPPSAFCSDCGHGFKLEDKNGKPFSYKQRVAQVAAHNRNKHTPKSADTSVDTEVPEPIGEGVSKGN